MRKIDETTKANAHELARAMNKQQTVIMDCWDARTNTPVFVLCAVNTVRETRRVEIVPFAILLEGNPYEYLYPPEEDGDGYALPEIEKPASRLLQ